MANGSFRVGDEASGLRVSGGGIWRASGTAALVGHYVVETDRETEERRVVCYLEPAWRTAEVAIAAAVRTALATPDAPSPPIRFRWLTGSTTADGRTPTVEAEIGTAASRESAEEQTPTAGRMGASIGGHPPTTPSSSRRQERVRPSSVVRLGSAMDVPTPPEPRRLPRISPYWPASGSVAVGAVLLASYVYRLLAFVGIDESGSTLWQTVLAGFLCLIAGLVCVILDSPAAYLGNALLLVGIGGLNLYRAGGAGWDSLLPFAVALLHVAAALLTTRSSRAAGG
jgi:hypothetical protein